MRRAGAAAEDGDMTNDLHPQNAQHSLRRAHSGRILAGVAGGIAEYLDVDVAIVRLGFVVLTLMGGLGVPLYAAAWLFVPEEGCEQSMAADLLGRHQVA
jgi:phage shock protein PspC (stress-responsive transcriptional regulator)